MAADPEATRGRRVLSKDRMEGFSDGVFGFAITLLAIRLLGSALDAYARHQGLYPPAQEGEELRSTRRKFLPVIIGYVIAILTGLALPAAAVALYFGIAVYLVVPFREAARVLRRRRSPRQ